MYLVSIDGLGEVHAKHKLPIHRDAPTFAQQQTTSEILETGIKVIDLLCPYSKGGKIWFIRWCRCR